MEASGIPEQSQPAPEAAPQTPEESPEVAAMREHIKQQDERIASLTQQAQSDADGGTDVRDLLNQLVTAQSEQRQEVQALRAELAKARATPLPASTARQLSPEELLAQRMQVINAHPYYCPGCGRTYNYQRECTGRGEAPHPAIDVVATDELKNAPDSSDKEAVQQYQAGHTPMEYVEPQNNKVLLSA